MITVTKVRRIRLDRLLSQAELAKRAGITEATLSRLEQGQQQPHYLTLSKLARALRLPATDLVDKPAANAAELVPQHVA